MTIIMKSHDTGMILPVKLPTLSLVENRYKQQNTIKAGSNRWKSTIGETQDTSEAQRSPLNFVVEAQPTGSNGSVTTTRENSTKNSASKYNIKVWVW
ncbi:unnamed protein product [Aspergillus oryzae]|uniref:Unnamed protein product n=1 Tax=Aspergillus oryzae TaxID=5062 RepID=A0AAN4YPE0_ASPOZ|nr:unnamed protein product [Aspergillus oryzae]GMF90670.1 unnamed protein product [Aspergillus oryzae]GMG33533.1 unnamed protein product [Aspergillus oryzae]